MVYAYTQDVPIDEELYAYVITVPVLAGLLPIAALLYAVLWLRAIPFLVA